MKLVQRKQAGALIPTPASCPKQLASVVSHVIITMKQTLKSMIYITRPNLAAINAVLCSTCSTQASYLQVRYSVSSTMPKIGSVSVWVKQDVLRMEMDMFTPNYNIQLWSVGANLQNVRRAFFHNIDLVFISLDKQTMLGWTDLPSRYHCVCVPSRVRTMSQI